MSIQTALSRRSGLIWLVVGDILTVLVITMVGFSTHGEGVSWRMYTTVAPLLLGWGLVAPWLGLYRPEVASDLKQVWRAGLAAFIAAPLAAWLRGILLNEAIIPVIFFLALGGSAVVGFLLWRLLWVLISRWVNWHG